MSLPWNDKNGDWSGTESGEAERIYEWLKANRYAVSVSRETRGLRIVPCRVGGAESPQLDEAMQQAIGRRAAEIASLVRLDEQMDKALFDFIDYRGQRFWDADAPARVEVEFVIFPPELTGMARMGPLVTCRLRGEWDRALGEWAARTSGVRAALAQEQAESEKRRRTRREQAQEEPLLW